LKTYFNQYDYCGLLYCVDLDAFFHDSWFISGSWLLCHWLPGMGVGDLRYSEQVLGGFNGEKLLGCDIILRDLL